MNDLPPIDRVLCERCRDSFWNLDPSFRTLAEIWPGLTAALCPSCLVFARAYKLLAIGQGFTTRMEYDLP